MRKVLLVVLVLVIAGFGVGIYLGNKGPESKEKQAQFDPSKPVELKFTAPEGVQFDYDVKVGKATMLKADDGKMVNFAVSVEMAQSLVNTGGDDKTFTQFMMDLYEDISLETARKGDEPLDAEATKRQLDDETRRFSKGVFIFNANKLLLNGLPEETPDAKDESQLVSLMLVYLQHFTGTARKIGESWVSDRKIGKYDIKYEYKFADVVYYGDKLCARIEGTVKLLTPTTKVEIMPTQFKLWIGVEDNYVYGSEIRHDYRTDSNGTWIQIVMDLRKDLVSARKLDTAEFETVKGLTADLVAKERDLRREKRDMSKDPEIRAFYAAAALRLGTNPFKLGADYITKMLQ